jgi:hypothetical protein
MELKILRLNQDEAAKGDPYGSFVPVGWTPHSGHIQKTIALVSE